MTDSSKRLIRYSRSVFTLLAWIFALCVVLQTLFAGLAIFTNPTYWSHHTAFVPWFQFIPIIMLLLSFSGKLSKSLRWQCIGLFLLIVPLQYASVHIPGIGAIHPVIALILFWLISRVIRKTMSVST